VEIRDVTTVDCERVQGAAKEYWEIRNTELRSLQFRWLELHLLGCQPCSDHMEDVIEKMNLKPPGAESESC